MTPDRYERVMQHFDALCDLPESQRDAHLGSLRAADPELAAELDSLLRHDRPGAGPVDGALAGLARAALSGPPSIAAPEPTGAVGEVVAGRYRLEKRLGAGGGGQVFRARDLETGHDVALKFLRAHGTRDARDVRRFRREFRAVARLDHPGVLRVLAEGQHDGRLYIAMEHMPDGDLEQLVGADGGVLLGILLELASALDYVHSRRIVHRDLKPANVLLHRTDEWHPKLADFGIARTWGEDTSHLTDQGALVGTLDYLSPEQVEGRPLDPRADLYALGCVIYKLWAGRPPFVGTTWQRLSARVHAVPPPLRELAPHAPAALEALAMRLLAAQPADRPQSALAVGEALAAILTEGGGAAVLASMPGPSTGGFLYRPGLVGRDAERQALCSFARAAFAGERNAPVQLQLRAEGGLGKTTLADAVRRTLEAESARVLLVRTNPSAGPLAPFSALQSTLDRLAPPESSTPQAPARSLEAGAAARRQLAATIAAQLQRLHHERPLLLILEDLHLADHGAHDLLAGLRESLQGASGPRAALLTTERPIPGAPETAAADDTKRFDLRPLPPASVLEIARAMLGVGEHDLPAGLAERLVAESDGNPLLVQSALRARVDRGTLRRTHGGWGYDDVVAAVPVLADRIAGLSDATRRVLQVATVIGLRFDADVLAALSGTPEDAVYDALDEALRANVVRSLSRRGTVDGDTWEFDHARLADALDEGLAEAERSTLHGRVGRLLADRGETSAARLAHHFLRSERRADAFEWSRRAAREAYAGFDYAAARRFGQAALDRIDLQPDLAADCREALGDALLMLGRCEEAAALFLDLSRSEARADPLSRARHLRKLGLARTRSGQTAGALAAYEDALALLGDAVPRARLGLFLRLARDAAVVLWQRLLPRGAPREDAWLEERALTQRELAMLTRWVDDERCAAHCFAAARASARLPAVDLLVDSYTSVAIYLAFAVSSRLAAWLEARAKALAHDARDRAGLGRILLVRGLADVFLFGEPVAGMARMDEGVALYRQTGDRYFLGWAFTFRGWAALYANRFDVGAADFRGAMAIGEELRVSWMRADAGAGLAFIDLVQGRLDDVDRWARAMLASDTRLALPAIEAIAHEVLGQVAFIEARYRDARTWFERASEVYTRNHLDQSWGFVVRIEYSESVTCLWDTEGEVPGGLAVLRANARFVSRHLGRVPMFRVVGTLLWAVYYARAGRPQRAHRLIERVMRTRKPGRGSYVDAWTLWRVVFERRRLGESAEAVRPLFDELVSMCQGIGFHGILPWFERARVTYGL